MHILPFLYAHDLVEVLQEKHDADTHKERVIYIEAGKSGSIFRV